MVFAMIDLVTTYADEGRREEALQLAEKALALQAKLTGRAAQDSAFLSGLLGGLYDQMGRSAEAIPLLEQDMKREQQRWGANSFTALRSQRAIGVAYRHLDRRAEATATFEPCCKRASRASAKAIPRPSKACAIWPSSTRQPVALRMPRRSTSGWSRRFEALRARGDLSSENRQALFAQWVEAYKSLARLRVVAHDAARGFALAELSKARTLLESTAFRRAAQSAELSDAEQQRLQGFEHQLADLGDRVAGAQAEQKLILETRRDGLVRELTAFRAELAARHPKYARLSDVRMIGAEDGPQGRARGRRPDQLSDRRRCADRVHRDAQRRFARACAAQISRARQADRGLSRGAAQPGRLAKPEHAGGAPWRVLCRKNCCCRSRPSCAASAAGSSRPTARSPCCRSRPWSSTARP
ncbi:MAG: tetratricopeptide repeat protein [Pseudomonadota bacterium]